MKNIILGVTGSIAAYKAAEITSQLVKKGNTVHVIMTKYATEFIAPLTFQTISKNKVNVDTFQEKEPSEIKHISLSKNADVFIIAPASANIIGKLAGGIADNMLTSVALAVNNIPKIIAPAMNTNMYNNPIVQDNINKLKKYGYKFIEPKESMLACGDVGKGALADVSDIVKVVLSVEDINDISC